MNDRDKLIELIADIQKDFEKWCVECAEDGHKDHQPLGEYLADKLLANGVIVPPCKVGDRVYSINIGDKKTLKIWIEPNGDRITQIKINRGGYHFKCWWGYFHLSDIGKTVFLTKEDAEAELRKRSEYNAKNN